MKIAIIVGTRPEIIKLAPIINNLKKENRSIIFTGQHYDFELSLKFFKELVLPKPDYKLKISRDIPAIQMGEIISKLEPALSEIKPDTVVVQGDTNTALAGAICSLKKGISISHVESGLRSHDWRMPEEHNRIAIDHISDFLFAATKDSRKNLISEKTHGKIYVTGNTVMDSIKEYIKLADRKSTLETNQDEFILFTMHRAENVDDKATIKSILDALLESSNKIIFPIHPRTLKRLKQFGQYHRLSESKNVTLLDSVGYFDMLKLMKRCSFIVSDSGGIQEEATSPLIRKKVLVIRKTTDRPEAVKSGFSIVVGTSKNSVLKAIRETSKNPALKNLPSPYGNGQSGHRIVSILKKLF
jgi:UDP-N-acetylglucosamine 2-epimerase (non-hydrolysing)